MKLSVWAKRTGITYHTAWKWFDAGKLPVKAIKTATGTILVEDNPSDQKGETVIYARVSSHDQKNDLDRQVARTMKFAAENKILVNDVITEIGSGLNGRRPKLVKLLANKAIKIILVEHAGRLMRFGGEYVESSLSAHGRKLTVIDKSELTDDLVWDMIDVLTSFCARLYGRRSAKNKAKKALKAIEETK